LQAIQAHDQSRERLQGRPNLGRLGRLEQCQEITRLVAV
jgi:hypothetical protein